MHLTTFDQYLSEVSLKPGMVCKSLDKIGDLSGQLIFIKKINGNELKVVLADGTEASTTIANLNVDPKSVRPYNPEKDPKFK
jgi:hypothetical protein